MAGGKRPARVYRVVNGIAVLPVTGTLVHRLGGMRPFSGMTGYDGIVACLQQAMADSQVRGVLLDIIAEVRVWNRALSTGELQMNLCGVDSQSEGLVAYWKMNEGEGHIFKDATGHGYDMDWTNTAREINEGAGLTYNLNYSSAIAWDSDDNNRCNE